MENLFTMPKKIILLGSLLFFFSCSQDEIINNGSEESTALSFTAKISPDKVNVFKGPKVAMGNDSVRSWISVRKETGLPVEIGIEMTPGSLEGLPENGQNIESPTYVLPLHLKAKQLTPFKHIGINWQDHGHGGGPNNNDFMAPHFDFHFYMIFNEERLAIPNWCSCPADAAFNIYPPAGYMPLGYVTPPGQGSVYGQMGKHWLPVPFNYLPFTKVMVYGTYDGQFIFVEPMATRDYLLSNVDFSGPYSQPLYFEKAGYYPTMYNIRHDPKTGNTNLTLSEFVYRVASPN
ncbi:MAG TPA: DUF5602 domain-containing protein [Flavobacterium sp.]|nr:DUF5602 domain-containing protein [Flavobacterium sp.]